MNYFKEGVDVFCPFWQICQEGKSCKKALNDEIRKEAFAANMDITYFTRHPECFKVSEEE